MKRVGPISLNLKIELIHSGIEALLSDIFSYLSSVYNRMQECTYFREKPVPNTEIIYSRASHKEHFH